MVFAVGAKFGSYNTKRRLVDVGTYLSFSKGLQFYT